MTTVTIDDEILARFRATASPGEEIQSFAVEALRERLKQRESERWRTRRNKAQAILNGPRHSLEDSSSRIQRKYSYPDLSQMTPDALAEDAERVLAEMSPEARAALEQEGLL